MHSKSGIAVLVLASASYAQLTLDLTKKTVANSPIRANTNVVVPEVDDQSFWFANFSIGASQSLEILIDTGSADVYTNPGVYQPGPNSVNKGKQFSITFATTNSDGSGTETVSGPLYQDSVGTAGITVKQQTIGSATSPKSPPPFPHDGLIGFASQDSSASNSVPWFQNVCNQKLIPSCRFGLAFKTDGTGTQTLGTVDPAYANSLATVPLSSSEWVIQGDIAAEKTTVANGASIITDSGTTVVYGPLDTVRQIFQQLNIPTAEHQGTDASTDPSYIFGFTPCDAPPAGDFGINFAGTEFNIESAAWNAKDNGNNNCTSVLQGTDSFGDQWLVGQAFFQGKYIDHNVDAKTMGFANLENSNNSSARMVRRRTWHA